MDNIGKVATYTFNLFGQSITVNPITISMTWLVIGILVCLCVYLGRNFTMVPSNKQSILEMIYEFIADLTNSTLGSKQAKTFIPFIFMIFTFTLLSNWIGIVPNIASFFGMIIASIDGLLGNSAVVFELQAWNKFILQPDLSRWYAFLFKLPAIEEPTRSVNTDLAMALMVFAVVHVNSFARKGPIEYLKQYWGDVIPCRGWYLLLAPINIMIILNLIGEVSAVVSHSFRLFGNIFGGFMIFTIVSSLIHHLLIPVGLLAFFGLFAGLVQAFVFTMLAITYIGQKG